MKRTLYVITIVLLTFTGCKKEKPLTLSQQICGEWRGEELSVETGIYIGFASDGTFELYQKLQSEEFELRRGSWNLSGDILTGTYNDNEAWATSYKVSVSGSTLTLVSQGECAEINVYRKYEIPEVIKENSNIVVKSGSGL